MSSADRGASISPTVVPQPKRRTRGPIIILTLTAIVLAVDWYGENILERIPVAESHLVMLSVSLLATISLIIWFVVRSSAPRGLRIGVGGFFLAMIVVAVATFRIDSVSGNVMPKLALRWTKKADRTLAALPAPAADSKADLTTTGPNDFPQFLGIKRDAVLSGPRLAHDWGARPPRKVWRQPIGAGWSSFAVVGNYAVTQEQRADQELVTCYEVATGKNVWSHADEGRFDATIGGIGPRATPTIHEGRVYTVGAQGLINCLSGEDGAVIWQKQPAPTSNTPQWGKSCSPLVTGEMVVVSVGLPNDHSLVAFNKLTGEGIWSGGDDLSGYSSPLDATLAGRRQFIIVNHNTIAAHDPANGKVLWTHEWDKNAPNVSQPVPIGADRLFVSKGYAYGCQLWQIKAEGDTLVVDELWQNRNMKTKFTNVVVKDDYVYGLDEGILVCLDLADGSRKWKQGRYDHGQILLVGDFILIQSETGEVALVRATPESHQELTRFQAIDGKTWNNPVLSGRMLLVRNDTEAACYELPVEE